VAASNPNAKFYANQPTVAMIDKDTFALNYNSSNGAGKNNDVKGANTNHLMVMTGNSLGFNKLVESDNVAAYATHSSLCATNYGVDGKRAIAIMGAPASGVGTPSMQLAFFDPAAKTITAGETNRWTVGFAADSGFLSNIYGQNPTTQGRDFLTCTGDIANPGHGVKGGYMSNVETFLLAPHSGRNPGEPKNALFLSFVPSKTDAPALPQQPTSLDPQGKNGTPSPTSGAGGSTSTGVVNPTSGAGGSTGTSTATGEQLSGAGGNEKLDIGQPGGCACAVPGSTDSSGEAPLAVLAALGLAVAMISRRKES
jgi:MYXO-CTERM domain-containing protein